MVATASGPALSADGTDTRAGSRAIREEKRRVAAPRVVLAAALTVVVLAPVVLAVVSGSLAIPHNDAWSYSRIGQRFGETGEIRLLGWNRSALVGQIVVLGPLAASVTAQQIFVALLAGVAVLACYDLLAPAVGRFRAALAALVLAIWPELGLLATSFMSDVPALAAVLGCLALGRRALARGSLPLLAGSLAVGLWGATIREQALAAPVAVLLAALGSADPPGWRGRPIGATAAVPPGRPIGATAAVPPVGGEVGSPVRAAIRFLARRRAVLAAGTAFGVAFLAFEWWRRTLTGDDPPAPLPDDPVLPDLLDVTVRGYFLLAIAVSPVVLAVARPWRWRAPARLTAAGVGAVAVLAWHDYRLHGFLMSDYLLPRGPYPAAFRGDRSMFGEPVFQVLALLAAVSGVLLAGLLVQRWRRLDPMARWFLLVTVGGLLATRAAGQTVFGRYLVVLVPVLLLVALAGPRRPRPGWAGVVTGLGAAGFLAALSLVVTAYGSALDAARWRAGEELVASGVPATDIDAGFEWSGYHAPNGVDYVPKGTSLVNWYGAKFADNRPCYVLASSAQSEPGWHLVRTVDYRSYVLAGTARLWVYDTNRCPPP
ncbi:hypothetical protein ACI2K4_11650 [Micromonospora sp. NPDC050397]|uniref:hypothetical protein n=1 Tax=Micromonospora sp. NPDC050397 TaxID=3364279 RepID=UPI003850BF98